MWASCRAGRTIQSTEGRAASRLGALAISVQAARISGQTDWRSRSRQSLPCYTDISRSGGAPHGQANPTSCRPSWLLYARIVVDFAGWDMPVNYGSADCGASRAPRRRHVSIVSHMLALDLCRRGRHEAASRGSAGNDVSSSRTPGKCCSVPACSIRPAGDRRSHRLLLQRRQPPHREVNAGMADKRSASWMCAGTLLDTGANVTLES